MKKLISMFLVLVLFIGFCPVTLAGGIDKVEILSDGTKLTYVSTKNLESARQMFADRINKNRERKFSAFGNLAMKAASFAGGTLLCYAASKIENAYLRSGLIICTGLASFLSFFYPEYVRYDVDQVENHRVKSKLSYLSDSCDKYLYPKHEGLRGLLDCIDQSIDDIDCYPDGIIIVERPKNSYSLLSGGHTGIAHQNPYDLACLRRGIEEELRQERANK